MLEKLGGRTRARTWDPIIKSHLDRANTTDDELGPALAHKQISFPSCRTLSFFSRIFADHSATLRGRKIFAGLFFIFFQKSDSNLAK